MKKFSQFSEELNFNEDESQNIKVGSYETEHFNLCPGAIDEFKKLMQQEGVDMGKVEDAAKHVDQALAVEARAMERGHSTQQDMEDYDMHALQAEEILDELGELESHQYYLRDVHEPKLADMLNMDTEFDISKYDDEDDEEVDKLQEEMEFDLDYYEDFE